MDERQVKNIYRIKNLFTADVKERQEYFVRYRVVEEVLLILVIINQTNGFLEVIKFCFT